MGAELWLRNPHNYIKEVVEVGETKIAFDRGLLVKLHIDPAKFCELHYGPTQDFRVLAIGTQGTAEYVRGDKMDKPTAVYPTWNYLEDTLTDLEEMMAYPVGEDPAACGDGSVPPDERPVLNQEHRVVVVHLPHSASGPGRKVLREMQQLQDEYPECILHVHGLYSFRAAFSHGFAAADIEARVSAFHGKVTLPNGRDIHHTNAAKVKQWVHLVGMSTSELDIPRNRCMFNIRSAAWASKNFTQALVFKTAGFDKNTVPDVDSPDGELEVAKVTKMPIYRGTAQAGDKITCDSCSLATTCKYYREGSVCTLPGAEMSPLVQIFKTRDAGQITDGLAEMLSRQATRFEMGMEEENDTGELDSEVTRIANSIMTHGNKLAKLLKPELAGPKVGIFVGGNGAVTPIVASSVGDAVRQLEASGIPRDAITEEMVMGVMSKDGAAQKVTSL